MEINREKFQLKEKKMFQCFQIEIPAICENGIVVYRCALEPELKQKQKYIKVQSFTQTNIRK